MACGFLVAFSHSHDIYARQVGRISCSPVALPQPEEFFPISSDTSLFRLYFAPGYSSADSVSERNREVLDRLRAEFGMSFSRIDSVTVHGYTATEGVAADNRRLTEEQARAVGVHIQGMSPVVHTYGCGEDWEGLYREIAASSGVPYRREVLYRMEQGTPEFRLKEQLTWIENGEPYRYMRDSLFPLLRRAEIRVFRRDPVPEENAPADTLPRVYPEYTAEDQETIEILDLRRRAGGRWALKTDLLYWAALLPNIEAEFCFGRRWSLNIEAQCAWWSQREKHRYYQLFAAGPEVRFRFAGPARFHGHFVGLYGNAGFYDLENRKSGYRGEFWSAGITYSYLLPIGRSLALEFGLGAGILSTEYKSYLPQDGCYVYQQTKRMQYIGVTKARLSLVWRFGTGGGRP